MNLQPQEKKTLNEPFVPWEQQERLRPKWVQNEHGETIAPQRDQKSNNSLTDEQVLQSRTQPIVEGSQAAPLNVGKDGGPIEPSGAKRIGVTL